MESGGIRPSTAASAAAAPVQLTAEEEALKRNTDCVYFLASPLTCKKGSECEYRHSEGARVNPRDCWYWLNGNCTNRKCAFRHPPLDALFGAPPNPAAAAVAPQATAYNPTKQSTACYYFQKGNCLKGDRCPFMHGPSSVTGAIPQQPVKVSASPIVPSFGALRKELSNTSAVVKPAINSTSGMNSTKTTQEKTVANVPKLISSFNGPNGTVPAIPKPRAEITVNNTRQLPDKAMTSVNNNSSDEDHNKFPQKQYRTSRGSPVQNRDRSDERPQDSREGDEFLGESSPGFDVLVDHEEDSGYLPQNEEEYRRAYADAYDPGEMYPLDNYELMTRYERDRHGIIPEHEYEPEFDHEADRFGYKGNDPYERKRRRRDSSPDRAADRSSRRRSHREESGVGAETEIDSSDLRHRLVNKSRKLNGSRSRSDASPDKRDDRHHRNHPQRDDRYPEERDHYRSRGTDRADHHDRGAVHGSNRLQLQGRIKMPLRSAERSDFMHEDVEMQQRRHLRGNVRVSPVPSDFPGRRPHERIGRRSSDREIVGGPAPRRDEIKFAGPKRLAELKGKASDKASEPSVKDNSVDFEGPMPLSLILKRKREAAGVATSDSLLSENKSPNEDTDPKEVPAVDAALGGQEVEEGMISEGNGMNDEGEAAVDERELGEDQEMEAYDDETREDLSYYEGAEGEEYKMEDENAYQEEGEEVNGEYPEGEEDCEDDDEQAFARKVGVMLS